MTLLPKKEMRVICLICIGLFIFIPVVPVAATNVHSDIQITINDTSLYSNFLYPPIVINGDDEFTSENGVIEGDGTIEDPYVIADWIIPGNGLSNNGILIRNTTAHFKIENCIIQNFIEWDYCGIRFEHVINGSIKNCQITNVTYGIHITSYSRLIGIYDTIILNESSILKNAGIYCRQSSSIGVNSCVIAGFYNGIHFVDTRYCGVLNTDCFNNSFAGSELQSKESASDGFVLANNQILNSRFYDNGRKGIYIRSYRKNPGFTLIRNCDVFNNIYGIDITNNGRNFIDQCAVYHNYMGILLLMSSDNTISNCSIHNQTNSHGTISTGVVVTGWYSPRLGFHHSWNNQIEHCDIVDNDNGFYLYQTFNTKINKNLIERNEYYGVEQVVETKRFCHAVISQNNIVGNGFGNIDDSGGVFCHEITNHRLYLILLNAQNNWWGSTDGPNGRGSGSGDTIDWVQFCLVRYNPWLTEPVSDAGRQIQ